MVLDAFLIVTTPVMALGGTTRSSDSKFPPVQIVLPAKASLGRMFKRADSKPVVAVCAQPREVCKFVERNIRYRGDICDEWQTPEETLRRRAGDCEDFAVLVQDLCQKIGYASRVYLFFVEGDTIPGHAIVAGQLENGRWWFADNGTYYEAEFFRDLGAHVAACMHWPREDMWYVSLDLQQVRSRLARGVPASHSVAMSVNVR